MKRRGERWPPGPRGQGESSRHERSSSCSQCPLNIVTCVSPAPALSQSHERCELLREGGLVSLRAARWRLKPLVSELERQREADL